MDDQESLRAALAQLRLRLLDLTGHNRLLNFKPTAGKSLQFVEGQPAAIFRKLVDGAKGSATTILGLPEPSRSDWVQANGRMTRPDPRDWAVRRKIPISYDLPTGLNLRALLYPDDLAKHCRKIEREANLAIEETGANMLFLVAGFLEFPDQKGSDKIFAAPLIIIPVSMSKKEEAGHQVFSLQYTGDDISENLSLREKLMNDYSLPLPQLNDEKVDVEAYFGAIDQIVQKYPGFAVRRRITLSLLSFTNMLLVRDLDPDKWPKSADHHNLLDHPLVREVFGARQEPSGGIRTTNDYVVDDGPGAKIPLIYDADSSQHSALVDAIVEKRNLVIEGPPGTGKSQTITNLIAACLADGKKVLFFAEKIAALDVVKSRLSQARLGSFVLELHSNKTNKKQVLDELNRSINFNTNKASGLPLKLKQLESHRADLKNHVELINSTTHNRLGRTLQQVMWAAERSRLRLSISEGQLIQISVADATELTELELSRRSNCLNYLGSQYQVVGGYNSNSTFWGFFPNVIVPGDEAALRKLFESSSIWSDRLANYTKILYDILEIKAFSLDIESARSQLRVLRALMDEADASYPLHLFPIWFSADITGERPQQTLEHLASQIRHYNELGSIVHAGLKVEAEAVDEAQLVKLRDLERLGSSLGVFLGTAEQVRELLIKLETKLNSLGAADESIASFCSKYDLKYDHSRNRLSGLTKLVKLFNDIPEEYIHLQSPQLYQSGCVPALEALLNLINECQNLRSKLDKTLYLDPLPSEGDIKQAVFALRQGWTWYRVLQKEWRTAMALHKSLQRTKKQISIAERLGHLEKILELLKLEERWKASSTWQHYLGTTAPAEPISLDGQIALARWNRAALVILEEMGSPEVLLNELKGGQVWALRLHFASLATHLSVAGEALQSIDNLLPTLIEVKGEQSIYPAPECVTRLMRAISDQLPWFSDNAPLEATLSACVRACEAVIERGRISLNAANNADAKALLDQDFFGIKTNVDDALSALAYGRGIAALSLPPSIKAKLKRSHPLTVGRQIIGALEEIVSGLTEFEALTEKLKLYGEFDPAAWVGLAAHDDLIEFADGLRELVIEAAGQSDLLIPWSVYVARRSEALEIGLGEFAKLLEGNRVPPNELSYAYAYCAYSTIVRQAFKNVPQLGQFSGLQHNQIREEFRRLDREIIELRGTEIAAQCHESARPPGGHNGPRVDDKSEMVLLKYLLPQTKPRMPVRKMLMRAGRAIQELKPCFMMGPQAVAQYLTPGCVKFDLVVMDEASQLKPEEAIGAIARGGQLIVVGDPKQLPPTSFFSPTNKMPGDGQKFVTTDAESILDVCSAHFRQRQLRWHYRSQHHSLIAFSNAHFYGGNLIVFPSPYGQSSQLGVRATYLADAIYDHQTNLREAKRCVEAVAEHITVRPRDSIGIVTLNIKQRDLIAELLDERLRSVHGADEYREKWREKGQPLFVKNLENVQGDERDAIIISTTFGRPAGSKAVRQNFGPISRQGGWRRLNVLFTRAKKSIAVYTSLRPEDIVVDGSTPEGAKALRTYLEYAQTGVLALPKDTGLEPDSDFEVAVIDMLRLHGYEATPQLGVAGYRIDIAVKHPTMSGVYLAAIECDGATYHSALSVRDRDRIRQEILESMGWRGRIWRIWSTDWFRSPRQEAEKLLGFLGDLRKSWKPEHPAGQSWIEEGSGSFQPKSGTSGSGEEPQLVSEMLMESDDQLEVGLGSFVGYVDINNPNDVLKVKIADRSNDLGDGVIAQTTPLAQTLIGAVVGDEVQLRVPGRSTRTYRIVEVRQP